jgi:hypothetical protein
MESNEKEINKMILDYEKKITLMQNEKDQNKIESENLYIIIDEL